jgi:hypothetical protein
MDGQLVAMRSFRAGAPPRYGLFVEKSVGDYDERIRAHLRELLEGRNEVNAQANETDRLFAGSRPQPLDIAGRMARQYDRAS